jgi:hypothetical protein
MLEQLVRKKTQLVPKRRILVPKRKDFFKKREDFKYKGGPSVLYGCRKRQNGKCRKKCRNRWTPEDLPTLDPINTEDTYIDLIGNPAVSAARGAFLASWKTSVEVETRYQIENSKNQTRTTSKTQTPNLVIKREEEKKAAHKVTSNRLNLYVYAVIKDN